MQARELAAAADSVYILGPDDHLRFILRGEEGLWGSWQDGDVSGRSLVHVGSVVARIALDGRVSALQRKPSLPWYTWDLEASTLSATLMPDGAPALFAIDADGGLHHTWKASPSTPWAGWQALGGPVGAAAATAIPGGGLAVFGIAEGEVRHRWQDRSSSAWQDWTALGVPGGGARAVQATTIERGGPVVFALGRDGVVYHRWQDRPFRAWHEWEALGGDVEALAVTRTLGGGLAALTIGTDREVRCRFQSKPFGEWSRWINLRGEASSLAAQPGYTSGLEAFVVGLNAEVYHNWCEHPAKPWTGWRLLERETPGAVV